jgi:hypothetical protein
MKGQEAKDTRIPGFKDSSGTKAGPESEKVRTGKEGL